VEGVGPETARAIVAFFREPSNRAVIKACCTRGVVVRLARPSPSGPLEGKRVAFTGALSSMSRTEAEKRVRGLGGKPSSTVGANTDLVVVGAHPGSKLTRARRHGIPLLTERQLRALTRPREQHDG
jgi:DNA ligase (NAD+)